jgi:hypothetical protein
MCLWRDFEQPAGSSTPHLSRCSAQDDKSVWVIRKVADAETHISKARCGAPALERGKEMWATRPFSIEIQLLLIRRFSGLPRKHRERRWQSSLIMFGCRMKVTTENIPTIATWVGLALLVIAANFSTPPPGWLTLPAWLIFGAGIGIRISLLPANNPYKQASAVTLLSLLFMANFLGGPVFLLITEPSIGHLFLPRPFHVLVIVYLSLLCVFLNAKIQRLQSHTIEEEQRHADVHDPELTRANQIVDRIQAIAEGGGFLRPVLLSKVGASSTADALAALYLVTAETFRNASLNDTPHNQAVLQKYLQAVGGVGAWITTMFTTDGRDFAGELDESVRACETVDSFVDFLRTIEPSADDYWRKVYARIKRSGVSELPTP